MSGVEPLNFFNGSCGGRTIERVKDLAFTVLKLVLPDGMIDFDEQHASPYAQCERVSGNEDPNRSFNVPLRRPRRRV